MSYTATYNTLAAYGFRRDKAFTPKETFDPEIFHQLNSVAASLSLPPKALHLLSLVLITFVFISLAYRLPGYQAFAFLVHICYAVPTFIDILLQRRLAASLRQKCTDLSKSFPELEFHVYYGINFSSYGIFCTPLVYFMSPLSVYMAPRVVEKRVEQCEKTLA